MARNHADAQFDPDVLWTVGRAADRARVTHAELIGWVRDGRLEAQSVWRDGVQIRVVRAGDVAELAPAAREPEVERGSSAPPTEAGHDGPDPERADPVEAEAPSLAEEVERLRARVARLREPRAERPAASASRQKSGGSAALLVGLALGALAALAYVRDPFDLFPRGSAVSDTGPAESLASLGPVTSLEVSSTSVVPAQSQPRDAEALYEFDRPTDAKRGAKEIRAAERGAARAESTMPAPVSTPPPARFRPPAPTGRRWLADLDPASAQAADRSPCAYVDLVRDPEAIGAIVLGPCIGPYAEGGSPPGTHRVDGVSCCAHHAFVERMTRASQDPRALDSVRGEAEAALGEEVVPPLLLMRAERAATLFLRDFVGHWVDAGLGRAVEVEGGRPPHVWSFPAGLEGRNGDAIALPLRLESWVRLREGDAPERFVLELTLSDGSRGDSRDAFRWIDDEAAEGGGGR